MKVPVIWKLPRFIVLLGLAAVALPPRASGQNSVFLEDAPAAILAAAPGLEALADIDARLQRGEWEPSRAAALARIEADLAKPTATELARDLARLALAEAGLGRREDALWHWGAAQNLDPTALSPGDLAAFGAAGELLARHPLRHLDEAPAGLTVYRSDHPGIQPANRIAGEIPKLPEPPEGMEAGVLRIQGIVDLEGRFREPIVLGEGSPATIYRVLEALREWRYEPAWRNRRRIASFRSVYVGALGEQRAADTRLRLGSPPAPGPGGVSPMRGDSRGPTSSTLSPAGNRPPP